MSDYEGDYEDGGRIEWDGRPDSEDSDFSLDPTMLGRVSLTDDGQVFADVYTSGHPAEIPEPDEYNFTPLEDLLGFPHDDQPDLPIYDWSDYVPEFGDDIRTFPDWSSVDRFLHNTGFWDFVTIYEDDGVYHVEVEPSP